MTAKNICDLPIEIICCIMKFIWFPRDIQNLYLINRRFNWAANRFAWDQAFAINISCQFSSNIWTVFLTVNYVKIRHEMQIILMRKLNNFQKIWFTFGSTEMPIATLDLALADFSTDSLYFLTLLIMKVHKNRSNLKFLCIRFSVSVL
jgi:hypothetical protein